MDKKNSLEGLDATFNVEKPVLMAVPLNRYKTLREQINDHLKKEFDVSDHSSCRSHFSFL